MKKTSLNEKLAKRFLREIVLQKVRCRFEANGFSTYYDMSMERECYFQLYPTLDPKKVIHTRYKEFILYVFRCDCFRKDQNELKKIALGTLRIKENDFLGVKVSIRTFPNEVTIETRNFKITAFDLNVP